MGGMAKTSPTSIKPNTNVSTRPGRGIRRRPFIVAAVLLVLIGALIVLWTIYSSGRNDGDGAADRTSLEVRLVDEKQTAPGVTKQSQSATQTVSQVGQEVTVTLYANSGGQLVNTVQTMLRYPKDSLQLISVSSGTAFPRDYGTDTATAGVIKLVRAVESQAASVKGKQAVATITFKKLQDAHAPDVVTVDKADSFLVTSSDNRDLIASGKGSLTIQ